MLLVKRKKNPSRYKSGIWSNIEKNYNINKPECREVLKVIKKVWYWLYRVKFILETNANILIA